MIVVCDLMIVVKICMHHIHYVLMGVAMFFDRDVMFRNYLRQFCEIMGDRTVVCRQQHTNRQSDGQQPSQVMCNLPCHSACSYGS